MMLNAMKLYIQKDGKTLVCTREYADRLKELLAKLPKWKFTTKYTKY